MSFFLKKHNTITLLLTCASDPELWLKRARCLNNINNSAVKQSLQAG